MDLENYENLLGHCIDSLKTCRDLSSKYLKDDDTVSLKIRQLTEEYCKDNSDLLKAEEAFKKLRNRPTNDNEDVNIDELYENFLAQEESDQDPTETDIWNSVYASEDIQEVKTKEKKLSDSEFRRLDESVSCSNVFEPPIDPMSKTRITDPYKNKFCGHIFEYKFILSYIKDRRGKAKCPYVGCTNTTFRATDLKPDTELKEKIKKFFEEHQDSELSEEEESFQ